MASDERERAMKRLEEALVEQARLEERFDAAVDTPTEFRAYVRLRAASDQVRAREAWLNWVDDEGYRGLNAGPFELLAESRAKDHSKVETMATAGRDLDRHSLGRAWMDGREVGGADPRYAHLAGPGS